MKCYYSIQRCVDAGDSLALMSILYVFRVTSNYYCIKDDKGFVTRFIWMCRCRFVVNRQTKKDRQKFNSWRRKETRKKCESLYIWMVWSTNPKWHWRLICKLRYSDYLIRGFMLRVKHTPCAIAKIQKKKHFQKLKYEQNWILRNFKPWTMSNEQESNMIWMFQWKTTGHWANYSTQINWLINGHVIIIRWSSPYAIVTVILSNLTQQLNAMLIEIMK